MLPVQPARGFTVVKLPDSVARCLAKAATVPQLSELLPRQPAPRAEVDPVELLPTAKSTDSREEKIKQLLEKVPLSEDGVLATALTKNSLAGRERSEKKAVAEEAKDNKYFERRRRNNRAAKKSRDQRKLREDHVAVRAEFLEKENAILRAQVSILREELVSLNGLLLRKRLSLSTQRMTSLLQQKLLAASLKKLSSLDNGSSRSRSPKSSPQIND